MSPNIRQGYSHSETFNDREVAFSLADYCPNSRHHNACIVQFHVVNIHKKLTHTWA